MAKQIAKLLKATIQDSSDLKQIAKQLAKKGRGGDSMLVHITPREATMLKEAGGAGTINPDTGLMEFYDGDYKFSDYADFSSPDVSTGGYNTRADRVSAVPMADVDMPTPISPYSFAPDAPPVRLTPPESASYYSADDMPQRLYPQVNFAPPTNIFEGRATPFPISPEAATPSSVAAPELAAAPKPGFLEELGAGARKAFTSPRTLETLGLAGISAIPGILQAQQARKQGQRAREEMQAMAAPYRQRGAELTRQAQTGELSPAEQQQLQAMQARVAQGVAGRGGVGAEQAQVQLEAFRQQLLANKYDLGLKVSGIADQIATGAIRAGLEADQYVNELTSNYFSNAMQMAMMNMGQRPQGA